MKWTFNAVIIYLLLPIENILAKKLRNVLPPGYELVDGEAVDVTDKVIQVTTESGTLYYPFQNSNGKPIYIRDRYESGWHFIVFDDPFNQDPGNGHLIVLQRMAGLSVDGSQKIIYEVFLLSLEESIAADVEPYDPMGVDYYRDEVRESIKKDINHLKKGNNMQPVLGRVKRNSLQYTVGLKKHCKLKPFQVNHIK